MKKTVNLCFALLFTLFLGYGVFYAPYQLSAAVKDSLSMCAKTVIPSLFPFFIISGVIINSGLSGVISRLFSKIMLPLFNINGAGASALILGFISGFPVGASAVKKLYESGACTKDEAERLLAFANNTGPGFIISVIGIGIFGSSKIGLYIYLIQVISALLTGVLFSLKRNFRNTTEIKERVFSVKSFPDVFVQSVQQAADSSVNISAFIVSFSVIIQVLKTTGVLSHLHEILPFADENVISPCVLGLIELTNGVKSFNFTHSNPELIFIICTALVCFSGISVHCQTLFEISGSGLGIRYHFLGKLVCTFISILISTVFTTYVHVITPAFSPMNTRAPFVFFDYMPMVCTFLLCISYIFSIKRWKKS